MASSSRRTGRLSWLMLFFAALLLGCASRGDARRQRVFCRHVIDGDTIVLSDGRKVRYLEINAPEIRHGDAEGEPLGEAAARFNRSLVEGKTIEILVPLKRSHDRFGRLLAHVFLLNGKLVSELLVKNGLAHVCFFARPDTYAKRLLSAQRSAIMLKKGIWGIRFTTLEPYYIGNKRSLRFHRPWCPFGKSISPQNKVIFYKREDAFLKGYCRCKKCLP